MIFFGLEYLSWSRTTPLTGIMLTTVRCKPMGVFAGVQPFGYLTLELDRTPRWCGSVSPLFVSAPNLPFYFIMNKLLYVVQFGGFQWGAKRACCLFRDLRVLHVRVKPLTMFSTACTLLSHVHAGSISQLHLTWIGRFSTSLTLCLFNNDRSSNSLIQMFLLFLNFIIFC